MITREALRILVNNLGFARTINREYNDEFAVSGAKIGDALRIRKPARYTIRSGPTLSAQDHTETQETLTLDSQKGVDISFTSKELTLDIDDFSDRVLAPAMATIANQVDYDGLQLYKDVYNSSGTPGTTPATAASLLNTGKVLDRFSTPRDGNRCCGVDPEANAALVDGLKGLFQSSTKIDEQYKKGSMGMNTLGFSEIYMDQNIASHTTGAGAADAYQVAGANQTGATLAVDTGTSALAVGDVFTIAGLNAVNKQSRADTGQLQQFVVTAAFAGGTGSVSISPSIVTSGAFQTVVASPADNAVLSILGGASTNYPQNMGYHKDAFVLGTADLVMPDGVDFASRQVHENISMRIIRDYDINNDAFPCRIDVLYGWKTVYPELACRLWG